MLPLLLLSLAVPLLLLPGCETTETRRSATSSYAPTVNETPRTSRSTAADEATDAARGSDDPAGLIPTAPVRQVEISSAGLVGEAGAVDPTVEDFLGDVQQLVDDDRLRSAAQHVHRFPDLALQALHEAAPSPAAEFVAAVYDDHLGPAEDERFRWRTLLGARRESPDRHADFQRQRDRVVEHLEYGRFEEAARDAEPLAETEDVPPLLIADRLHWLGLARLLNERFDEAADAFDRAADRARDHHQPHQQARMLMLASHAHHRAGETGHARDRWQQALARMGSLLSRTVPLVDPGVWEQAVQWAPADAEPPSRARTPLDRLLRDAIAWPGRQSFEAAAWAAVGYARQQRRQPDAALLAFRRAESLADADGARGSLRLAMGRLFSEGRQFGPATSMLAGLLHHDERAIAAAATAAMGVMHIQRQQVGEGVRLIERALDEPTFPGRAAAEADLGLAYLLLGREDQGLHHLRRARERFRSAGDHERLVRSLHNEADYLRYANRPGDAADLDRQIQQAESLP